MTGLGEPFFLFLQVHPHALRIEREEGGFVWREHTEGTRRISPSGPRLER